MKVQYVIDGSGELERKLKQILPLAASDKVITSALRQAGRPILMRMKQLAPVGKGYLRSSLKNRRRQGGATKNDIRIRAVKDKEGEAKILIGVSKASGKVGKRTHFITQGIAGKGKARIGPRDFITQAYNQTVVESHSKFQSIMLKKLESAFARYGLK